MICPHCSFNIQGNPQVCPQCHIPLPASSAANVPGSGVSGVVAARSVQSSIKERRHNWLWLGGIGAIITGIGFLGSPAGVFFALLAIAAGIATLTISKFGKEWDNLTGGKKAMVVPGVVVGVGLLVVGYMFLYAIWYAFKSEFLRG